MLDAEGNASTMHPRASTMHPQIGARVVAVVAIAVLGCGTEGGAPSGDGGDGDAVHEGADGAAPVACTVPDGAAALPPGALASRQDGPAALAVDDAYVYWQNLGAGGGGGKSPRPFSGGQIMRCDKTGCANRPTELVSGVAHDPSLEIAFAVNAANVYFDDFPSGIHACAKGGCDAGANVVSTDYAGRLAADSANVYWAAKGGNEVVENPMGGGPPTLLYSGDSEPYGIAVDSTDVYFTTTEGAVLRCAIGGCSNAPTTLVTGPIGATLLALDAANVYWIVDNDESDAQILKCAKTGCSDPTILATHRYDPLAIATDGDAVYWIELGMVLPPDYSSVPGSIFRCATAGCSGNPTLMIDQQEGAGLALDSTHVYWTTFDSCNGAQVMMTSK